MLMWGCIFGFVIDSRALYQRGRLRRTAPLEASSYRVPVLHVDEAMHIMSCVHAMFNPHLVLLV